MTVEVKKPRDVPALRELLMDRWQPGHQFNTASKQKLQQMFGNRLGHRLNPHVSNLELDSLTQSKMWWVSAEMVDILQATIPAVPDETLTSDLVWPSPCGMVVFDKPILGCDAEDGTDVQVDCVVWSDSHMDAIPSRPQATPCLSVTSYYWFNYADLTRDDYVRTLRHAGVSEREIDKNLDSVMQKQIGVGYDWTFLGRSDWPKEDAMNQQPFDEMSQEKTLSFIEDRRLISALFTLLAQESIAETQYHPIDRSDRRRAERAGVDKEANELRVIQLRQKHRNVDADEDSESIPSGRQFSHRWVVNPFYRWQRVGVGRQERRLTLVSGHVRGPEDKPLKVKQEVRAWVR